MKRDDRIMHDKAEGQNRYFLKEEIEKIDRELSELSHTVIIPNNLSYGDKQLDRQTLS